MEYPGDLREFFCGWGAAFINICVTFPINKVIFRQMVDGIKTRRAVAQLRAEGLRYLYRGLLPPLMSKTASVSLMFGTYHEYHQFLETRCHNLFPSPTAIMAVSALMAGSTEAVLVPFERVQMLLQSQQFHMKFTNTFHAFKELKKYGLKEYCRGLTPILLRNGPSNVLFFGLRGHVKNVMPPTENSWALLVENFVTGALIGGFISTVFYPVNVIRTKMQTVPVGSPFVSIRWAAHAVYIERQKSIRKIFYGVHVNYTRAFISWGIINASYELLRKLLYGSEYDERFAGSSLFDPVSHPLPSSPSPDAK